MEFQIAQTTGSITCNFDELKKELSEKMSVYDGVVVSEDTVKLAKDDLANLRKVKKEIEDKRKQAKKLFNAPYDAFEKQVKELVALIDKPIELIDKQVKDFAERDKGIKEQHVRELYQQEVADKGYEEYLPFASIFNEKWLNKSTPDSDIIFDLNGAVTKIKMDMDALHALNSEFEDEIIKAYKASGNQLTAAIQRNQQLISAKQLAEKRVEEEKKAEEQKPTIQTIEEQPKKRFATFTIGCQTEEEVNKLKQFLSFNDMADYSVIY